MKKVLRKNTFETNSSSTHTLIIATQEDYDLWEIGERILNRNNDKLITKDEWALQHQNNAQSWYENKYKGDPYHVKWEDLDEDLKKKWIDDYDGDSWEYKTQEQWRSDNEYLTWFHEGFTTPSGDKMVVFGCYGYDG